MDTTTGTTHASTTGIDVTAITCERLSASPNRAEQTVRITAHDVAGILWMNLKLHIDRQPAGKAPALISIVGRPDMMNRNCIHMLFEVTKFWTEDAIYVWVTSLMNPRLIGSASPVGFIGDDGTTTHIRLELDDIAGSQHNLEFWCMITQNFRPNGVQLGLFKGMSHHDQSRQCYQISFDLPFGSDYDQVMVMIAEALNLSVPVHVFMLPPRRRTVAPTFQPPSAPKRRSLIYRLFKALGLVS